MTKPMKVIAVDPLCQAPFYAQYLCTALANRGIQVELWTREPLYLKGYFSKRSFPVRKMARVSQILFGEYGFFSKLFKYVELVAVDLPRLWIAGLRSDIVHVQWFSPMPVMIFERCTYRLLQLSGVKVIHTVHNVYPHGELHRNHRRWQKAYAMFDALAVTTEYGRRMLSERFDQLPRKIDLIPHGPFLHDVPHPTKDEAKLRIGVDASAAVVLLQGFINEYKGIEFLVSAFERIVKDHPSTVLVLAGTGKQDYIDHVSAHLRTSRIPARNIKTRFEYIPLEELPFYYSAADIVALPYKHIYQSATLFTALSFGKAVVASRLGGFTEVIRDGENGRFVDYGDVSALTIALEELLASREVRERLGQKGRETVLNEFAWELIAAKTEDLYQAGTGM